MTNQLIADLARVKAQFQMEGLLAALGVKEKLKWQENYDKTMRRYSGDFTDGLDNQHKDGVE